MKRILSTLLLTAMLTACGTGTATTTLDAVSDDANTADVSVSGDEAADPEPEVLTKEDYPDFVLPEATDTLTVYSTEMLSVTLNPALNIFKKMYPEVEVTSKILSDVEYEELIRTEIPAGRGPDLLFSHGDDLPDVYKTMSSGIFTDLNPYFFYDDEFNPENYFTGIMDSGLYGNIRYFVPVSCWLPLIATSEEILAEEGIEPDAFSTLEGIQNACEIYHINHPDNLPLADSGLSAEAILRTFFEKCGLQFIDYQTNTVVMDYDAMKIIADIAKMYYDAGRTQPGMDLYIETDVGNHNCLFNGTIQSLNGLFWSGYYYAEELMNQNYLVYTYPDAEGGSTAKVVSFAGIPTNTKNQLNAWRLMKILLSEEIQCGSNGSLPYLSLGSPVLKNGMRTFIENEVNMIYGSPDGVPAEVIDEYISLAENIDRAVLTPPIIQRYYLLEMKPYLTGKRTFDECYENLKNTIELYKDE